jgi:hypothetical protein
MRQSTVPHVANPTRAKVAPVNPISASMEPRLVRAELRARPSRAIRGLGRLLVHRPLVAENASSRHCERHAKPLRDGSVRRSFGAQLVGERVQVAALADHAVRVGQSGVGLQVFISMRMPWTV